MLHKFYKYFSILAIVLMIGCAKRGTINGGTKDTIGPVLKISFPENYSTNFKGDEIKLTFDEYIKLKNINKQLIISPPMSKNPDISPQVASKYIKIKFRDTLQANTTYSLNFGKSIEDNNEGNPYKQFKYVFSTGPHIDSLTLKGAVKDAYYKKPSSFVSVMLYEVNSKFKDSVVYKENPRYITNTLDSSKTFTLENLKAGKYLLVALKDENNNNKYDPKKERIGFHNKYITIPNDTIFEVAMFKEESKFKAIRPIQSSANRLIMGYEGNPKDVQIAVKNKAENIPAIITKFPDKDSLQIWFKPIKTDSLIVSVSKDKYVQDFITRMKNQKIDSLNVTVKQGRLLPLGEKLILKSSTPLTLFDNSKMQLINKDSVSIAFTTVYDVYNQELSIDFKREAVEKYKFKLLPGAITDFLDQKNGALTFAFTTKSTADYGNLRLTLANVRQFPVMVELTNSKGDVITSAYSEGNTNMEFNLLEPAMYSIRVIYDENKNKVWDSGNFLEKRQPEEVIYFPKEIDVRANWDIDQVVNLKQ